MKIDKNHIQELPIITNKIDIVVDREIFFANYVIISYYSHSKDFKNLAYEQLADVPFLSVAGIRANWDGFNSLKFFILAQKDNEIKIINSLKQYDKIYFSVDKLETYPVKTQNRIFASLAINSLGKKKSDRMMYHDGSLLICDDVNFGIPLSKKELVCLKIEVNNYLNLTAKTISFSHPQKENIIKHKTCIFKTGRNIHGCKWSGQSIKPVLLKDINLRNVDTNELYVQKKRFNKNKNLVKFWPFKKEMYTHGKLFAIWQVLESVNKDFDSILEISFSDFKLFHYDECKPGKEMLAFMQDYLHNKTVRFVNPFKDKGSLRLIDDFKQQANVLMNGNLHFPEKPDLKDLVIKLCEPKDEDDLGFYSKSLDRMGQNQNALQHIVYDVNKKDQNLPSSAVRRILLELLVKDGIIQEKMPKKLSVLIENWTFLRYKIRDHFVYGAALSSDREGNILIKDYGLSGFLSNISFIDFSNEELNYQIYDRIEGKKDYMALKKDGNVYLIIDTDEIPILDADLIDEGYEKVYKGETLSMFKRKAVSHDYLRGYIGFHMWKSEGLYGETDGSFSYFSGTNSENIQILDSSNMDKMPRARRIFILHSEHPENTEADILEIINMLKFGFGRWNEIMTYPFPFKYLQEYLDNQCEIIHQNHWSEI